MAVLDYIESEVVFEVKGYGDEWKVFYPDEGDIQTPFVWYDKEGKVKTVFYAGGSSGKLTEANETFTSGKAAIEYLKKYFDAENIRLVKSKPKKKKETLPL